MLACSSIDFVNISILKIIFAGADSTRGDGIYSGRLNANQLDGDGYYDWKVQSKMVLSHSDTILERSDRSGKEGLKINKFAW